jgi:hypothetical protein
MWLCFDIIGDDRSLARATSAIYWASVGEFHEDVVEQVELS